jgi:CheY-like chemotaxis protein
VRADGSAAAAVLSRADAMPMSAAPVDRAAAPPLRIFVVENHEDTRALLSLFLERTGHSVQSAATMAEALERWPASGSDVLVCDVGLPDGSGWELLGLLRPAPALFAVAISGYGLRADREKSGAAGFRRHLVKPVEAESLERVLDEAYRERDARGPAR